MTFPSIRPWHALLSLLLLAGVFAPALPAGAEVSPRLTRALEAEDYPHRADDGSVTIWVFFRDKGLVGKDLDNALDRAEANLSEKVAWRRSKMKARGARLVDAGDLEFFAPYLEAVAATGARPRRQSRWLNAASYQATARQIRLISQLPEVARVDLVGKFRRPEIQPETLQDAPDLSPDKTGQQRTAIDYGGNQAAMEQFNVPAVHDLGINGQGVIIGMLDTGFHTTHEALAGIPVLATYDFINDDQNVDNEAGDPTNANDHGTKTMSTAMGNKPGSLVAPAFGASAVLAKTEDVSQEVPIEEDQWVAGLEWVEAQGADIVSSSLGYSDWYTWADMDGATAVTTLAADLAVARGLVVINSAGNERGSSWDHIIAPADGFNVIAVGAVTSSGSYSYFSSPGPSFDGRIKPDVAALGSSNYVASLSDDTSYTTASGTSFSCPLTSGVAALILSRAPQLTPLQVRDALRETASRAQAPDNDYGWGLIDAHAAVTYFGPNFNHTPLPDTEDTVGPYGMGMTITDRQGLDENTALVWYRTNGGSWFSTPITATGGGPVSYFAHIPGQPAGTLVEYYLEAASVSGIVTRLPGQAPDQVFSFQVGTDNIPPDLTHIPLRDQVTEQWPPLVTCQASDNLGLDRVELYFTLNTGPEQGPVPLLFSGAGSYEVLFPMAVDNIQVGDAISYRLVAVDGAGAPNQTQSGPYSFAIVDAHGVVLVLDDAASVALDTKIDFHDKNARPVSPLKGKSSSGTVASWLTEASYLVDVVPAAGVTVADFQGYDVVVLASGNNTGPASDATMRAALLDWAGSGGKLLVEGGEIGYDALRPTGYADFAAGVLHAADWVSDNAGTLQPASGMTGHPLLSQPHALPVQIPLNYTGYGDQDAVTPAAESYVVMVPANHQADAGILVYDDNPMPQSAQTVFYAFNVESLDPVTGRQLVENTLDFLLAEEPPPDASLSGTVHLAGETDHSGITVQLSNGPSLTTGSDGSWSFPDLYPGSYSVIATKEGWSADRRDVELLGGQNLTGISLVLTPTVQTSYIQYPGLTIPDASPAGVTATIVVPEAEAGPITSVNVDVYIQHTWIGDLTVVLTSPQGTSVVLHNRSGAQDDNILGNWPGTRPVDGPGSLDDFIGESNAGTWILFLSDAVSSDEGQLSMWGLNFTLPAPLVPAPEDGLPQVHRLYPNVPNPFNPMTRINFDLAKSGRVRLDVFDVRGRRVALLLDENYPAGRHQLTWDGRDERGRAVSSGTYLYRLRAGGVEQMHKMQLVR